MQINVASRFLSETVKTFITMSVNHSEKAIITITTIIIIIIIIIRCYYTNLSASSTEKLTLKQSFM